MATGSARFTIGLLFVLARNGLGARLKSGANTTLAGLPREVRRMLLEHGYQTTWGEKATARVADSSAAASTGVDLNFKAEVHTCDKQASLKFLGAHPSPPENSPARVKQLKAMKHLRRVKQVFAKYNVPIIVSNGVLLGWKRSCLSIPKDPDTDFVVFGQWIKEAGGLEKLQEAFRKEKPYLSLETHLCKNGPLAAGCELRVTAHDNQAYSDIMVLFPPESGTFPNRCDKTQCGLKCEKCAFSTALWAGGLQDMGKYYGCPTVLGSSGFDLISFMGETFWAPKNLEEYLVSLYGPSYRTPGGWSVYKPCQVNLLAGANYASAPYNYEPIAGLPDPATILRLQCTAEAQQKQEILESAEFEKTLWPKETSVSPWDAPYAFLTRLDRRDAAHDFAEFAQLRRSRIMVAMQQAQKQRDEEFGR